MSSDFFRSGPNLSTFNILTHVAPVKGMTMMMIHKQREMQVSVPFTPTCGKLSLPYLFMTSYLKMIKLQIEVQSRAYIMYFFIFNKWGYCLQSPYVKHESCLLVTTIMQIALLLNSSKRCTNDIFWILIHSTSPLIIAIM